MMSDRICGDIVCYCCCISIANVQGLTFGNYLLVPVMNLFHEKNSGSSKYIYILR